MTRRIILALTLALASMAAAVGLHADASTTACQPGRYCTQVYPDPTGRGVSGDLATAEVIVVGDSIANGCAPEIRAANTAAGITSAVGFWSGRPTSSGVDWALSLSRKPPILVMELGSNDWANGAVMPAEIARLLAGLDPDVTQVMWIDTYNGNKLLPTAWVNQGIWGAPGITVVPWLEWFAKNPVRDTAYLRDHLHPTAAPGNGCAFFADATRRPIIAAAKAAR
jgi:hypothetical protein